MRAELEGVSLDLHILQSTKDLDVLRDFDPKEVSAVMSFMSYRAQLEKVAFERHEEEKAKKREPNPRSLNPGDWIMLKEKDRGKLQKRWRGPFKMKTRVFHGLLPLIWATSTRSCYQPPQQRCGSKSPNHQAHRRTVGWTLADIRIGDF
ncbi:hypothetical protein GX50_01871 [[Emmonsia] crescens]|uniref:Uncharacterized protein n=1 Tax=[Emmonsia] crescens TaxID=73230 RepID=A0A2B7ZPJ4_9EURO|nr:hypothetical protein GX50_01871 [Emmonsia crescens]